MTKWLAQSPTSLRPVKQGFAFVLACHAIVVDVETHKRDLCPHNHRMPSQGRKCAEREARRRNRRNRAS